jgi:hypothetical protein
MTHMTRKTNRPEADSAPLRAMPARQTAAAEAGTNGTGPVAIGRAMNKNKDLAA